MTVSNKSIRGSLRSLTVILAVAAMVLVSCRDEETDGMKGILYPVVVSNMETVIETRALTGSYSALTTSGSSIKAYAVAFDDQDSRLTAQDDKEGVFTRTANNTWASSLEVDNGNKYNIYTFSPTISSFPASAVAFIYNNGTPRLTFTDLDVITLVDPLVGIAAAGKPQNTPPTASDLTRGSYSTGVVDIVTANKTKVAIGMDHLYAKATISFKVDEKYNTIRTIKVTSATVTIAQNKLSGTSTYTYAKNGGDDASVSWSNTHNGSAYEFDLMDCDNTKTDNIESSGEIILGTDAKEFGWFCFNPSIKPNLTLKVTYDVYDKNNTTVTKTRSGQVVVNNNLLRKLPQSPAAGNDYKITVKVNPTYLYQLSDGDAELELEIE